MQLVSLFCSEESEKYASILGGMGMRRILLGLSLTPKVGWKTIHKIILEGIETSCFNWSVQQWRERYVFLKEEQCVQLSLFLRDEKIRVFEESLESKGISYISIIDDEYSGVLKEIFDPPWILYTRGNLSLLQNPALSIVGSRKTSQYGRIVTQKITPELVREGWVIVSGLALGIDAISHESTLKAKGKTIGVLGSGIDIIYPEHNRDIYHQMKNNGLIISEYPPGTAPHPSFFPRRNRIIAGLSHGTIVIEAAKQSGSLITAHCALEQGREVFAIPGSIFDRHSVGTNLLIQQHGAKLVTNTQDILQELLHVTLPKGTENKMKRLDEGKMVEDIEKEILELLWHEKVHMNELSLKTKLPFAELTKVILKMEMKGLIKALPGSYYQHIELSS